MKSVSTVDAHITVVASISALLIIAILGIAAALAQDTPLKTHRTIFRIAYSFVFVILAGGSALLFIYGQHSIAYVNLGLFIILIIVVGIAIGFSQ